MDIKNKPKQPSDNKSNGSKKSSLTFKAAKATNASSALMLPLPIQSKLSEISAIYGLPMDIGKITLHDVTPTNIQALRKITTLISSNSQLLPEMLQLIKQLLNAEIKLSAFHAKLTKAAIKHQEALDKDTANIFLTMAGYAAKGAKLQHRTNTRNELIDHRTKAYDTYYQNSVFGEQSRIIDAEFQLAASNQEIQADARIQRKTLKAEQKEKALTYITSAFAE